MLETARGGNLAPRNRRLASRRGGRHQRQLGPFRRVRHRRPGRTRATSSWRSPRLVGRRGSLVLNADDAQLRAQADGLAGRFGDYSRLSWFALDADQKSLREYRERGAPTCGVRAGRLYLSHGGIDHDLGRVSAHAPVDGRYCRLQHGQYRRCSARGVPLSGSLRPRSPRYSRASARVSRTIPGG